MKLSPQKVTLWLLYCVVTFPRGRRETCKARKPQIIKSLHSHAVETLKQRLLQSSVAGWTLLTATSFTSLLLEEVSDIHQGLFADFKALLVKRKLKTPNNFRSGLNLASEKHHTPCLYFSRLALFSQQLQ